MIDRFGDKFIHLFVILILIFCSLIESNSLLFINRRNPIGNIEIYILTVLPGHFDLGGVVDRAFLREQSIEGGWRLTW